MKRTIALLLALTGCERAEPPMQPENAPPAPVAPSPVPAPMPPPAPAISIAAPTPTPAPKPKPVQRRRPARVLSEAELPTPPSEEPAAYAAWLRAQPRDVRAQIDAFCRSDGLTHHAVCGGIGPYHIPMPPSLVRVSPDGQDSFAAHDAWYAALTPQQRRYIKQHCINEETAFTDLCGGTPLVVQLDLATPIEIIAHGVNAAQTPWLVLDRNADGQITGDELFGDATPLPDGSLARNGFAALAPYDANGDGVIDARDPIFPQLALWNGRELSPLAAHVTSIELANHREPRCSRFGCEGERSALTTITGARGAVVDVYVRR